MLPGVLSVYSSTQQAKKIVYDEDFEKLLSRLRISIKTIDRCLTNNAPHDHVQKCALYSEMSYYLWNLQENFDCEDVSSITKVEYQLVTYVCNHRHNIKTFLDHYNKQQITGDVFHVNLLTSIFLTDSSNCEMVLSLLCQLASAKPFMVLVTFWANCRPMACHFFLFSS